MYKLIKEDLSNQGGPMWKQEPPITVFEKYFHSLKNATKYADKDFGKKITWKKHSSGAINSPDFGWCTYTIEEINFED